MEFPAALAATAPRKPDARDLPTLAAAPGARWQDRNRPWRPRPATGRERPHSCRRRMVAVARARTRFAGVRTSPAPARAHARQGIPGPGCDDTRAASYAG